MPPDEIPSPSGMAIDDTYLYVVSSFYREDDFRQFAAVWRVHRERGGGERLAIIEGVGGSTTVVASDEEAIYVSEVGAIPLQRISKSDPGNASIIDSAAAVSIAVDDTHIYWVIPGSNGDSVIKRQSKVGGEPETLVRGDVSPSTHITISGGFLYWEFVGQLLRMPTTGGEKELVGFLTSPSSSLPWVQDLRVGPDGLLYWLEDYADGQFRFMRSALDSVDPEPLVTESAALVTSPFFLEGDHLYWAANFRSSGSYLTPAIRHAPTGGGEAVTVAPEFDHPFVPTASGIYVAGDTVRLIPPEGCP